MKYKLRIAGTIVEFNGLDIGRTVTFGGAGAIIATAIRRLSKNYYKAYLIMEHIALDVDKRTAGEIVEYLQRMYDKYGVIPQLGDFKG